MIRLTIVLLCAVLVGLLGWHAYPRVTGIYPLKPWDQRLALISRRLPATEDTVDVLFVGNSFTFTHAMPAMLANLASSDPGNPVRLRIWTVTRGGATLADHRRLGEAEKSLAERSFDYVVLNEQSGWAYHPDWVAATSADVAYLTGIIRRNGAEPVLLETWADGADASVYTPGGWLAGKTPGICQDKITEETARLARAQSLAVVRVGQAFRQAQRHAPEQDLFNPDQHHPSAIGAYLSAATFYSYFTGRSAAQSTWRPPGLTEAGARDLTTIAAQ